MQSRTVNVYLTSHVIEYLAGAAGISQGHQHDRSDIVVTEVSDDGGIFVEQAASVGDEGSGIWVDASGNEHAGPGGDFVTSDVARELAERRAELDSDDEVDPYPETLKRLGDAIKFAREHEGAMSEDEFELIGLLHDRIVGAVGKGDAASVPLVAA